MYRRWLDFHSHFSICDSHTIMPHNKGISYIAFRWELIALLMTFTKIFVSWQIGFLHTSQRPAPIQPDLSFLRLSYYTVNHCWIAPIGFGSFLCLNFFYTHYHSAFNWNSQKWRQGRLSFKKNKNMLTWWGAWLE